MKILCTFPGRAGDLLWALPTMRAIADAYDTPVNLVVAGEFRGMLPLLQQQPYFAKDWPYAEGDVRHVVEGAQMLMPGVRADDGWGMDGAKWISPYEEAKFDRVFHLGYTGWPTAGLPFETFAQACQQTAISTLAPHFDLLRPWIQVDGRGIPLDVAVGFTEAWFELKFGLLAQIDWEMPDTFIQLTPPGSRWVGVPPASIAVGACDWLDAARAIRNSDLFFGDCSALHVLAVALGRPCILMEPMEARHNDIFYPLGKGGPAVTLVTGNDGLPTFDARHCMDALRKALHHDH